MNRIIKFRAWNKEEEKIEYDVIIMDGEVFLKGISGSFYKPDGGLIPMQYTGLLDKEKKEIYEGDILKSFDLGLPQTESERYSKAEYKIVEVKFHKGAFITDIEWEYARWNLGGIADEDINKVEVIGNIYENGELINK